MTPFGGPYCIMGRKDELAAGAAGFELSLMPYMVASSTWGSIFRITLPIFCMLSLGGLLGSSLTTPFRLTGFVQYFSKMPSFIHFCRERVRDSARTPLRQRQQGVSGALSMTTGKRGGMACLPLLNRLVFLRGQIIGLGVLDGRQRVAGLYGLGQLRLLDNGLWCRGGCGS
jgi:hypothetical protein